LFAVSVNRDAGQFEEEWRNVWFDQVAPPVLIGVQPQVPALVRHFHAVILQSKSRIERECAVFDTGPSAQVPRCDRERAAEPGVEYRRKPRRTQRRGSFSAGGKADPHDDLIGHHIHRIGPNTNVVRWSKYGRARSMGGMALTGRRFR
jgi:hypothetical protein